MPPKPGPDEEPELEELDKVDTKPVSNIESETKQSDVKSDVMVPIKLKCTVEGCPLPRITWSSLSILLCGVSY